MKTAAVTARKQLQVATGKDMVALEVSACERSKKLVGQTNQSTVYAARGFATS
jgi:hypothetical protein